MDDVTDMDAAADAAAEAKMRELMAAQGAEMPVNVSDEPEFDVGDAAPIQVPTMGSSSSAPAEEPAKKSNYKNRLARAKSKGKMEDDSPAPGIAGGIAKLDLSALPKDAPVSGDHKADGGTLTTPRAKNEEVVLTVRGAAKHKQKQLFKMTSEKLGNSKLLFAWRPQAENDRTGVAMATASVKSNNTIVHLLRRDGSTYNTHTLGAGKCIWLEFDCKGATLGILQEGAGIFLWDLGDAAAGGAPTVPMSLAPSITTSASFCKWSKVAQQLAIGTTQGKVNKTMERAAERCCCCCV